MWCKIINSLVCVMIASTIMAQTEVPDSVKAHELKDVIVEAQFQSTSATVSTYIPTSKQKNSSQTGFELLGRMAIPRLSLGNGRDVKTASGNPVDIFIDFVLASEQDLTGMRISDVKKVEYYDFPEDPRFQGKAHAINFIMHKYEYGGYLKAYANEFFIANSGQLNLYSKIQYKRMTYDIAVGGYYQKGSHDFNNTVETYRLPMDYGAIKQFKRYSDTDNADSRQRYFWPTFKTLYNTDKITLSNTLGANFDNRPKNNTSGSVCFFPADFTQTDFVRESNRRENYITYNGYWNFILPHGNVINFAPYYSYSHTRENSRYEETGTPEILNMASDNSHKATGTLRFKHDFGKWGDLTISLMGIYTNNKTHYEGSSSDIERLATLRIGLGVSYGFSSNKFYGMIGIGLTYDHTKYNDISENETQPWADLSLQYAFNNKSSISAEFHHMSALPSLSYRSSSIIQSNPLMSYTGNPNLTPFRSYDLGISYLWLPNNKFSLSVFGSGYIATNRFAYVYKASSDGILRTIQQPLGNYYQGSYGVNGTLRLLNGNLQISGQLAHIIIKSGEPYDWTKSHLNWYLQSFYYLKQWHFGLQYQSDRASTDGFVKGTWNKCKSAYTAIFGWGNLSWSFQAQLANPFRWNWRQGTSTLNSKSYDFRTTKYSPDYHCYIYVAATYTFGFGKKVNIGDEATQQFGAGDAILK